MSEPERLYSRKEIQGMIAELKAQQKTVSDSAALAFLKVGGSLTSQTIGGAFAGVLSTPLWLLSKILSFTIPDAKKESKPANPNIKKEPTITRERVKDFSRACRNTALISYALPFIFYKNASVRDYLENTIITSSVIGAIVGYGRGMIASKKAAGTLVSSALRLFHLENSNQDLLRKLQEATEREWSGSLNAREIWRDRDSEKKQALEEFDELGL